LLDYLRSSAYRLKPNSSLHFRNLSCFHIFSWSSLGDRMQLHHQNIIYIFWILIINLLITLTICVAIIFSQSAFFFFFNFIFLLLLLICDKKFFNLLFTLMIFCININSAKTFARSFFLNYFSFLAQLWRYFSWIQFLIMNLIFIGLKILAIIWLYDGRWSFRCLNIKWSFYLWIKNIIAYNYWIYRLSFFINVKRR